VTAALTLLALLIMATTARADLGLNVYGDIGYLVERQASGTTNSFMSPRLELFYTATEDRLSFLSEVMMEVGDDNAFAVDVERVEVGYLFADWFRLRLGRFHTAIGYYNDAYHHGRYFQITVDRPEMVRFEDEGGLIPAHSVGLHADGRIPLGRAGSLRYDADLANGRGRIPDEVTNLADPNKGKAVNLRLRYEPAFALFDGLIVGVNAYFDSIDANSTTDPTMPVITHVGERIYGAHLAYLEYDAHLIAELLRIEHRTSGAGPGITTAGFVELGYTIRAFTPYARYDRVKFPALIDPFFALNKLALRGSFQSIIAGVRYVASEYVALKLEGGQANLDAGGNVRTLAVQCAFAF
jgi:hypothetical protein